MIDTIGMTDIGNGRPSNQDAYLLRQKEKNGKLYLLAVVCDGMGGLKKGEIASHYIVEVLKQNQNAPVPVEKQVAILYAVTKGILSNLLQRTWILCPKPFLLPCRKPVLSAPGSAKPTGPPVRRASAGRAAP